MLARFLLLAAMMAHSLCYASVSKHQFTCRLSTSEVFLATDNCRLMHNDAIEIATQL